MVIPESFGKGDWLSIDAGMRDMGCFKVIRIVHEHRGHKGYILGDSLSRYRIRRIKIDHSDIISKVKDPTEIEKLERRLAASEIVYNIEEEERKEMYALQKRCREDGYYDK